MAMKTCLYIFTMIVKYGRNYRRVLKGNACVSLRSKATCSRGQNSEIV